MNHDDPASPRVPHPFFHTMVVMGSAVALGCGGLSGGKVSDDGAGGGGTGGAGGTGGTTGGTGGTTGGTGGTTGGTGGTTGGTGGTTGGTGGTTAATGGSSVGGTATAGAGGSGGSVIIIGMGGTGNVPVTPGPFPCAPETWTCKSSPFCAGPDYILPSDCTCDGTRPASAEDCAADQSFVCHQAGSNASYQRFTEPVAFACSCIPSDPSCDLLCAEAFGSEGEKGSCILTTTGKGRESVLCGCAQIVLR